MASSGTVTETLPSESWKPRASGWSETKEELESRSTVARRGLHTDVQTAIRCQVDRPNRVGNTLRFVVQIPLDNVTIPDLPNSGSVWIVDLWNPDVPAIELDRRGEDGRGREEKSGKSGHELHRERDCFSLAGCEGEGDRGGGGKGRRNDVRLLYFFVVRTATGQNTERF